MGELVLPAPTPTSIVGDTSDEGDVLSTPDETAVEEISPSGLAPTTDETACRISDLGSPGSLGRWKARPCLDRTRRQSVGRCERHFPFTLMRRMGTPIASRWAHIALRDTLLAKAHSPRDVNPIDWVAERSWLLLRLGEADAARMLVDEVDTDRFTPKMVQVAVQTAPRQPMRRHFVRSKPAFANPIPAFVHYSGNVCLACRRSG